MPCGQGLPRHRWRGVFGCVPSPLNKCILVTDNTERAGWCTWGQTAPWGGVLVTGQVRIREPEPTHHCLPCFPTLPQGRAGEWQPIRPLATPKNGCHWFREMSIIVLWRVSHLRVCPTQLSNEAGTETAKELKWLNNLRFDDPCVMK